MQFAAFGPQGLAWDLRGGKPYVTEFGFKVFEDPKTPVPANYGGGTWENAIALNQRGWTVPFHHFDINPQTGLPYNPALWPDVQAARLLDIDRIWRQQVNAADQLDYLKKNNLFTSKVGTSYVAPDDTVQIQSARATCKMIVRNASWRMAFAANEAEFNSIWAQMKADLRAAGWEDVVRVDLGLAANEVAARQEALRNQR
jgi:multiple sugar transport system substrate-binding protein/putative aldouronate transport system substrate-binding protein